LFGPFDIRKLRDGELLTNTEGMLPEGEIIFLDELLNANSAILNSLLMALNERVVRRGRETRDLGFVLTVGASNRLPEEEEEEEALAALFDRFLLRVQSNNVRDEQLGSVLQAGWQLQRTEAQRHQPTVSVVDVQKLQACIPDVDVSGVRQQYLSLIHRLRHAGIEVSDRRAVKLQRLAAASALMCGRTEVHLSDLWILRYIWDTMEQVELLNRIVDEAIASRNETSPVQVHPRASGGTAPDPEQLARDLEQIAIDVADAEETSQSWLSDRLSILAARIEWVQLDESREFLRSRVTKIREQLTGTKAAD
jgi:MoxR-like ATPase